MIRRENILKKEIYTIIIRLLQLKETQTSLFIDGKFQIIESISSNDHELISDKKIIDTNPNLLSFNELDNLCKKCGYKDAPFGSRKDITINGNNIYIRSLHYTNRPLINHSTRDKYLKVCNILGISIAPFDKMINEYWRKRTLGVINEDVRNTSEYSPFATHKEYLKPILTYIAFNGTKEVNKDSADYILDYENPFDSETWHIYSKGNYIDTLWKYLRFSFRADRGMPQDYNPESTLFSQIHPWVHFWNDQYKGALHIRIVTFNSNNERAPKLLIKHKKEIQKLKANRGERDEILIKIFLLESKMKGLSIPLDQQYVRVQSVGKDPDIEFNDLPFCANWNELSEPEIISITQICHIAKASSFAKADVFVNRIGISLKSQRGGAPTLINQTTRCKILRVMQVLNQPIIHLDKMVEKYWDLRITQRIGEDISNNNTLSPFLEYNSVDGMKYLTPLLNYFAFTGTGTRDSDQPAQLILEFTDPFNQQTWIFYNPSNYISTIWKRLIFSIRKKGLPTICNKEDIPWIRELGEEKRGTLNVRVSR